MYPTQNETDKTPIAITNRFWKENRDTCWNWSLPIHTWRNCVHFLKSLSTKAQEFVLNTEQVRQFSMRTVQSHGFGGGGGRIFVRKTKTTTMVTVWLHGSRRVGEVWANNEVQTPCTPGPFTPCSPVKEQNTPKNRDRLGLHEQSGAVVSLIGQFRNFMEEQNCLTMTFFPGTYRLHIEFKIDSSEDVCRLYIPQPWLFKLRQFLVAKAGCLVSRFALYVGFVIHFWTSRICHTSRTLWKKWICRNGLA